MHRTLRALGGCHHELHNRQETSLAPKTKLTRNPPPLADVTPRATAHMNVQTTSTHACNICFFRRCLPFFFFLLDLNSKFSLSLSPALLSRRGSHSSFTWLFAQRRVNRGSRRALSSSISGPLGAAIFRRSSTGSTTQFCSQRFLIAFFPLSLGFWFRGFVLLSATVECC